VRADIRRIEAAVISMKSRLTALAVRPSETEK
jgi:hypothetical protein